MGKPDHKMEHFQKVSVCGIRCEPSDMRIDRSTVPDGRYQYGVAGDDDSGGDTARVRLGIMVGFFGTLIRSGMDIPDLKHVGKNGYRFICAVSDPATHAKPIRETADYRENMFARAVEGDPLIVRAYEMVCAV